MNLLSQNNIEVAEFSPYYGKDLVISESIRFKSLSHVFITCCVLLSLMDKK